MDNYKKTNLDQKVSIRSNTNDMKGATLTITNSRFSLYPYSADTYALVTYTASLSNKVNALLDFPYGEIKITKDDEPLFKFKALNLSLLVKTLRLKI